MIKTARIRPPTINTSFALNFTLSQYDVKEENAELNEMLRRQIDVEKQKIKFYKNQLREKESA